MREGCRSHTNNSNEAPILEGNEESGKKVGSRILVHEKGMNTFLKKKEGGIALRPDECLKKKLSAVPVQL